MIVSRQCSVRVWGANGFHPSLHKVVHNKHNKRTALKEELLSLRSLLSARTPCSFRNVLLERRCPSLTAISNLLATLSSHKAGEGKFGEKMLSWRLQKLQKF